MSPASFSLDDDSDATLSNTRTFTDVVPGSGFSVSETVPGGWDQTGATCDDGSPVSNVSLSAGEHVTCTFTNRKRGKIVVVKDAQPDDPQNFGFTAGGGLSPTSFTLDDDADGTLPNSRTFDDVTPGSRLLRVGGGDARLEPDRRDMLERQPRLERERRCRRDRYLHVRQPARLRPTARRRAR